MARGSVSDVGAVLRGSLAQNRVRVLIAVLAIALGVALGFAVQLINQSAVNELTQGVRTLAGDADLSVRGPRSGFDEALFPRLAARPGRRGGEPGGGGGRARRGPDGDAARARARPLPRGDDPAGLFPAAADGVDTLRSDTVFLSQAAARWVGRTTGETVAVQVGLADVPLRVAGTLAGAGQQRLAVMDIAGAQAAFDRVGRLTRIDLRLRPGVAVDGFRQRIATGPARRGSRSSAPPPRSPRAKASRVPIASTSTCWRWSRCSPAGCSCSRRRRSPSCAGARSSRCCACWA